MPELARTGLDGKLPTPHIGVSENRVPYSGVLKVRILLFRVLY